MSGAVQVLRLVTDPGDAVVVNSPVYAPFYAYITHDDRRVVEAPLGADNRIDLEVLEKVFRRAGARGGRVAYLLCNPHNPTGTVHSREELTAVAALARSCGVRVVVDEIHAPLVLAGAEFTPYLSVPGTEDAFSLMSASKGWNLAGLKAALAVAGPEAAADLARMPEEVGHGASYLGVIAHTAAFQHGDSWLDALLGGLENNRPAWVNSSASISPTCAGHHRRAPIWPGWTAGVWVSPQSPPQRSPPQVSPEPRSPDDSPPSSRNWTARRGCSWTVPGLR